MIIDRFKRSRMCERPIRSGSRFRLVGGLLAISTATAMLLALPLAEMWPRQWRAEATIAAENVRMANDTVTAISLLARSDAVLDRVVDDLGLQQSRELAFGVPSAISVFADLIFDENTTVVERNASVREHLAGSIDVVVDEAGTRVTIVALANDASAASMLANAVARQLRSEIDVSGLVAHDPRIEEARLAAEKAEEALTAFTNELGPESLAALRLADSEARALAEEIASTDARLRDVTAKRQHVSGMTLKDVLEHPLPDGLEFTALDYQRQRHVEAKVARDQLSSLLGPRHPRLQAAQGALEEAAGDIEVVLMRLADDLQRQQTSLSDQLADLKRRQTAPANEENQPGQQLKTLEAAARTSRLRYEETRQEQQVAGKGEALSLRISESAQPGQAVGVGLPTAGIVGLGGLAGLSLSLVAAFRRARREEEGDLDLSSGPADAVSADQAEETEYVPDLGVLLSEELAPSLPWLPQPDANSLLEEAEGRTGDEAGLPLADRIREILSRNVVPKGQGEPFPPLVAAVLSGDFRSSRDADEGPASFEPQLSADNDDPHFEQRVSEMRRDLAALRGRVHSYTAERKVAR